MKNLLQSQIVSSLGLVLVAMCAESTFGDGLEHANIEELVDRAEIIVRGTQEANDTIRIEKVYKGDTKIESVTIKDLNRYQTNVYSVLRDSSLPSDVGKSDVVAFLVSREDGAFSLVSSGAGVKRIHKGRVFAYHQPVNPGGYELSLSHETNSGIWYDEGTREPLNAKELEAYITIAIRRSRHFHNAVSLVEPKKRAEALSRYVRTKCGASHYYASKARNAIVEMGAPALPSLVAILQLDLRDQTRSDVIWCLGQLGSNEAIPILLQELRASTPRCRRSAIYALGELKSAEAVDPLCELLNHPEDEEFTEVAIQALGSIGDARATGAIVLHASSKSDHVRLAMLHALSYLKDPLAFEPLIEALGEPSRKGDAMFRSRALPVLYHSDKARGVPIFIEHLRSGDTEVVHEARMCLHWISKDLPKFMDHAEAKAWYNRQSKDENGVIILRDGR